MTQSHPGVSWQAWRQPRRRVRFNVGLSILFLPVVMFTGITVAVVSYQHARRLVTDLNHARMAGLARAMDWQLQEKLSIPVAMRQIAALMDLEDPQPFPRQLQRLKVLRQALEATPAISSYYLGYGNGERLQLRRIRSEVDRTDFRLPAEAAFLAQIGSRESNGRIRTQQVVLDGAFRQLEIRPDPLSASFDPRQRPWYRAALDSSGPVATPVYRFGTTGRLGISLAERVPGSATVVGADLPIDQASDALLELGRSLGHLKQVKLALVGPQGNVVALNEAGYGAFRAGTPSTLEGMNRLADATTPVFARIGEQFPALRQSLGYGDQLLTTTLRVDGEGWEVALARAVQVDQTQTYLAIAIPTEQLFAGARRLQQTAVLTAFLVLLVASPLVWLIARLVTRQLRRLALEAQAVQNFEFDAPRTVESVVTEIDELATSFEAMKGTIRRFLGVSAAIAAEPDFERLLVRVLDESIANSRAQGGALFLNLDDDKQLDPELLRNAAGETLPNTLPRFPLADIRRLLVGKASGRRATTGRISAEGSAMERRFAGAMAVDNVPYVSLPLQSRSGDLLGMLLLWFRVPPSDQRVAFMEAFSSTVATTLETRQLIRAQKALFQAFIELIAGSIDAKSPYTGGHCKRVPELTKMLAQAACEETEGPFAAFSLSEDRWEAVHVASWLHDCGKVVTPEYVVDKATKLETLYDRIHEVRMRFEVLKRDAWIRYYQGLLEGGRADELAVERDSDLQHLDQDFAFVAACNQGGEFLAPDRIERLHSIAQRTWLRTLDDRLGISDEELRRKQLLAAPTLPVEEPLLADRPDHRIERLPSDRLDPDNPWGFKLQPPELLYDRGELKNLSISRGTLTEEDRYKINEHIIHTIRMLSALPFPRHMKDVPELAGGHHETLIGTGYPKGLMKEEMSDVARMMAIADIFEALTAADRPYKPMKTLSQALKIMTFMRKDQHIDPELFALFIRSGVYKRYAEQFLRPEQIDAVDEEALLAG
ncbi:HD domain-containing phosphohydrolase [Synechococcus sp. CCY9202]|uniref:HD domain-containing phosphohydrolase n=1 Tax=Synechococcus sp. CCY9202 TaxID=174698 RepID=UPI002B1F0147|nr:HD domain-containing phosphohydrolase [Synechococcus sp. CCY9202]MEA5423363.1 HD domain-containing phosphohydrolase [Synechococcus sp. CCY9202]